MTQKPKGIIPLLFIKIWFITKNQLRSGLVKKAFTGWLGHLVNTGYKAVVTLATWRGKRQK